MMTSRQGALQRFERGLARVAAAVVLVLVLVAAGAALPGCSSPPAAPDREITPAETEPMDPEAAAWVRRDERPISDTHPYQINDYLIYPVKWNKVEDIAPTVQELFQARYGPGLVVIPHIATNKLLIYLPPPQERERAGAAGAAGSRAGLRTPAATRGASPRASSTRGSTLRR